MVAEIRARYKGRSTFAFKQHSLFCMRHDEKHWITTGFDGGKHKVNPWDEELWEIEAVILTSPDSNSSQEYRKLIGKLKVGGIIDA